MTKMKFIGVILGQTHEVIVDDHDEDQGLYSVSIGKNNYEVDARAMPQEILSLLIDHKSYDIDLDEKDFSKDPLDGRLAVRVKGRVIRFEMLDERRLKMKEAQSSHFAQAGLLKVCSPMPGKILRFQVKEGDEVKEGQGLVVVEAMKMENEIQAPKSGIIKAILAKEGVAVESGAPLLSIE